jgi:ATP-binding cassette subfamily F protein uup
MRALKPTSGFVKIGKSVQFAVLTQRLDELGSRWPTGLRARCSQRCTQRYHVIDGKETSPSELLERWASSMQQLTAA